MKRSPVLVLLFSLSLAPLVLAQLPSGVDQFGAKVDVQALVNSELSLVFFSAERDAYEKIEFIENALGKSTLDTLPRVRISNLSALPFFVPRKAVVNSLQKKPGALSLVLDWKGELTKALELPKGSGVCAYKKGVIHAQLVYKGKEAPSPVEMQAFLAKLGS